MKKFFTVTGIILLVLAGVYLLLSWLQQRQCKQDIAEAGKSCDFFSWQGIRNLFYNEKKEPVSPEGSSEPVSPASGTYQLKVTKTEGATVYAETNGVFTATSEKIPYQTEISGEFRSTTSGGWYKTSRGWLHANDISIDNQSPH